MMNEQTPLDAGASSDSLSENPNLSFFASAKARLHRAASRVRAFFARVASFFADGYRRHPRLLYLYCFLLPAAVMFFVHAAFQVYPFGENSILVLDMNAQYIQFFEALRRFVYGDASMLYSFSRNLGGEFPGIYAYYLSSPLSFIVALFPKRNILEALYTIYVVKCGLCGLTFSIFLKKIHRLRDHTTLIFSCCYALSGYGLIMQHNTMWTDCELLLPLICVGVYSLIRERKYKLYTLSLALAIFSNYYIGYMMCLFMFLYFFYCYFTQTKEERNPRGEKAHFVRALIRMGIFSAIAVLIACIIVLPAYYSLQFGKNEFSNPTYEFTSKFKLFDILGMFLFNSYHTVRPEGLPILYCGVLSLLLIPLFFVSRRFRIRERLGAALIMIAMLASFSVKMFDLIWHGFQAPNWLNYRYSFMLIFLLLVLAARAYEGIAEHSPRVVGAVAFFLLLSVFILQVFGIQNVHDFAGVYPDVALVVLYAILIVLIIRPKKVRPAVIRCVLSILVVLELFAGALLNLVALDDDVVVSSRPSYLNYLDKWQPIVDQIKEEDPNLFYRMEFLNRSRINDPFSLGTYGVSGSTSTLNAKVIAFLAKIGISSRSHAAQYSASNPLTDSLISMRYVMRDTDSATLVPTIYEKVYDDGVSSCYLNPDALPIAYAVDPMIRTITFEKPEDEEDDRTYYSMMSPFAVLNIMLRCMLGQEETLGVFTPIKVDAPERVNLSTYGVQDKHVGYSKENKNEYASLTYSVAGDGIHEVYAFFPTKWPRSCYYYFNGKWGNWMFNGLSTYGFINLGVLTAGEINHFSVYISNDEGRLYLDNSSSSYFYLFDDEAYRAALGELATGGINLTSFREDRFAGTINVPEGRTAIFTTIPYDKGWIVKVDGKKVETYENLDALLGFDAPEGEHEIEFRYMPDLYVTAARLSLVGTAAFLAILGSEFVYRTIRKNKEKRECTTISKEN